jgi:hypothetical protein
VLRTTCGTSIRYAFLPTLTLWVERGTPAVSVEMGLARVERAAYRLGGNRSIHLSYSPNACYYSKWFCRLDSYKISAAVIETFKDSTVDSMGIFTR